MAVGRPRAFDVDRALEHALQVFWQHGYEGASLAELTKAMAINPPSLYAAFGNKETLFRAVAERYAARQAAAHRAVLAQPQARAALAALLHDAADRFTRGRSTGCLLVHGALACSDDAAPVREALAALRAETEAAVAQRLAAAADELPPGTDPVRLARYAATVMEGMAVQAAGGANADDLHGTAEVALLFWPA